ncbi:MAG: CcmD family protein [Cytophagaceae bacterium]
MRRLFYILFLMISFTAVGQNGASKEKSALAQMEIEMADALREDGKIYVVVAVIVLIFIGILFYLITLDKKITKVEESIVNHSKE